MNPINKPTKVVIHRSLDYQGMAEDLAQKLDKANKHIDQLVSVVSGLANELHLNHGANVCEPGSCWQECSHPACQQAQEAFKRLLS